MLYPQAPAFNPGDNGHQLTPVQSTEDDLCAWLRNKACLSEKVIGKAREKLDEADVDTVQALRALHQMDGLSDFFTRVPARQVADALDAFAALSISPAGQEPPSSALMTPVPATRTRTSTTDDAACASCRGS